MSFAYILEEGKLLRRRPRVFLVQRSTSVTPASEAAYPSPPPAPSSPAFDFGTCYTPEDDAHNNDEGKNAHEVGDDYSAPTNDSLDNNSTQINTTTTPPTYSENVLGLTDIEEVEEDPNKLLAKGLMPLTTVTTTTSHAGKSSELTPLNQVTFAPTPTREQSPPLPSTKLQQQPIRGILHTSERDPSSTNAIQSPGNNQRENFYLFMEDFVSASASGLHVVSHSSFITYTLPQLLQCRSVFLSIYFSMSHCFLPSSSSSQSVSSPPPVLSVCSSLMTCCPND